MEKLSNDSRFTYILYIYRKWWLFHSYVSLLEGHSVRSVHCLTASLCLVWLSRQRLFGGPFGRWRCVLRILRSEVGKNRGNGIFKGCCVGNTLKIEFHVLFANISNISPRIEPAMSSNAQNPMKNMPIPQPDRRPRRPRRPGPLRSLSVDSPTPTKSAQLATPWTSDSSTKAMFVINRNVSGEKDKQSQDIARYKQVQQFGL